MALDIRAQVGPSAASDGTPIPVRAGKTGEIVVTELHGRYFEQTYRGKIFSAANQAAQAVSVNLATTYTGLVLYNPLGSGVMLVPNKVKFALSVAPAGIAPMGLLTGFASTGGVSAQTTPLTAQPTKIGSGAKPNGVALSAATIVTPTVLATLWDGFTAAALPNPTVPVDLEGLYEIDPGGFIGIWALTAVTGLGWIAWEEVPLPQ